MYICKKCGETFEDYHHCCDTKPEPYTGGQAYQRKDGFYSWKFFVNGDQRAKGTNRYNSRDNAIKDFIEVFLYTPAGERS